MRLGLDWVGQLHRTLLAGSGVTYRFDLVLLLEIIVAEMSDNNKDQASHIYRYWGSIIRFCASMFSGAIVLEYPRPYSVIARLRTRNYIPYDQGRQVVRYDQYTGLTGPLSLEVLHSTQTESTSRWLVTTTQ